MLPLSILNKLEPVYLNPSLVSLNNRSIGFCNTLHSVHRGADEDDAGT